jgi:hypothetical protein
LSDIGREEHNKYPATKFSSTERLYQKCIEMTDRPLKKKCDNNLHHQPRHHHSSSPSFMIGRAKAYCMSLSPREKSTCSQEAPAKQTTHVKKEFMSDEQGIEGSSSPQSQKAPDPAVPRCGIRTVMQINKSSNRRSHEAFVQVSLCPKVPWLLLAISPFPSVGL